jgi:hypothetical protein
LVELSRVANVSSTRRNGKDLDIAVNRLIEPTTWLLNSGEDWAAFDWSPDDRKVILRLQIYQ